MMAATRTKPKPQVYAVVGSDESEVKRAAKKQADELRPAGGGDFGADIIDGVADHADQAAARVHSTVEALLTYPFFGGEKLVWLRNANFLGDSPTARAQAVTDALDRLAATLSAGLPESTRFLLSATEIDKRRSFYKGLQKLAKVVVFDRLDTNKAGWEEQAQLIVQERARARNLRLDSEALELFTLFTGGDGRVIDNELEKLDVYLGSVRREIGVEAVRLLVPVSRAGVVFELGNALAERNLNRALDLLDQLLFQGESPIGIMLVAIIPTVRNLLVARDLMVRHKLTRPQQPFFFGRTLERLPADAIAHLPRRKDGTVNTYALGIAAMHTHRYTAEELRAALEACLEGNVQLVTSALDPEVALSQLLVRVIARR
ncbi:MAG: DNA polymerase III subunit delta [Verrucomicrobiota bacterium]|nr:DNA polymerase III subunit delta [Verrucomicrobiota bacterium]